MPFWVVFRIVPPLPSVVPVPVTVKNPAVPPPLISIPTAPPLAATLWKVTPLAPIVELLILTAVPVVVAMELPVPVTLTPATPLTTLKPVAVVVSISSPPPEKVMVALSLLSRLMPTSAPVLIVLVVPEKVKTLEPKLFEIKIPLPVSAMFPLKVAPPPVVLEMLIESADALVIEPP